MASRESDNVFLLTLVDFLVQIIFFGLLIFVFYKSTEGHSKRDATPEQIGKALDAAGVSNIVELTDELTKLAPVGLKGVNQALDTGNPNTNISKTIIAIKQLGGGTGLVQKVEYGQGKAACLYDTINGQRRPRVLASAVGDDVSITFESETPELHDLLTQIGLTFPQVQNLPFNSFRSVLKPVLEKYTDCRYTIKFTETSRIVDARDAAQSIFYTQLRR
jgi:hypothetical protein